MARTEAEKYRTRRYQDRTGRWHNERELIHDARYCDICDSENVDQPAELVTGNGWYGGIRINWGGNPHGPQIVEVNCRSCRQLHDDAYWTAERRELPSGGLVSRQYVYHCPGHRRDHYEDQMDIEYRDAQYAEARECVR